jgi:hypothetical protein
MWGAGNSSHLPMKMDSATAEAVHPFIPDRADFSILGVLNQYYELKELSLISVKN